MTDKPTEQTTEQQAPRFEIQRIYVKDLSFEAPHTPQIFLQEWQPEVSVDLGVSNTEIDKGVYEVVLSVTVTAKMKEKIAFLVEVKYAGIFVMMGFPDDQLKPMLGALAPNILFPYARETVSDIVTRGSFPQLLLAPVNFDAYYQQQQAQTEKTDDSTKH